MENAAKSRWEPDVDEGQGQRAVRKRPLASKPDFGPMLLIAQLERSKCNECGGAKHLLAPQAPASTTSTCQLQGLAEAAMRCIRINRRSCDAQQPPPSAPRHPRAIFQAQSWTTHAAFRRRPSWPIGHCLAARVPGAHTDKHTCHKTSGAWQHGLLQGARHALSLLTHQRPPSLCLETRRLGVNL